VGAGEFADSADTIEGRYHHRAVDLEYPSLLCGFVVET